MGERQEGEGTSLETVRIIQNSSQSGGEEDISE